MLFFYSQPKKTGPPLSIAFTSFTLVADRHGQVKLNTKFILKNRQWKKKLKEFANRLSPSFIQLE